MIKKTIWPSIYKDALYLYIPGVVAVILSHWIVPNENSLSFLFLVFIALGVLDSGHVYSTLWRTYLNPQERVRSRLYIVAPLLFFILFYLWNWLELKYLAAFVVYITVFHNVRQLLGISRWYQKNNKIWNKVSDVFLYALCLLPFLAFHFRSTIPFEHYYGTDELFFFPQPEWYSMTLYVYAIVLIAWLIFEIITLRKFRDFNRTFSVFFAGFFYATAFLLSQNSIQVLFPLVVSHGFSYLALMDFSMRKLHPDRYKLLIPTFLVVATAVVFGGAEFMLEDEWFHMGSSTKAFTTALFLTPLFCHYYFDGFLWKRQHPDSAKIYG